MSTQFDNSPKALRESFYGSGMAEYYGAVDRAHKERMMARRNLTAKSDPEPAVQVEPVVEPVEETPVVEPVGPISDDPPFDTVVELKLEDALAELSHRELMNLPPAEDDTARSRKGIA